MRRRWNLRRGPGRRLRQDIAGVRINHDLDVAVTALDGAYHVVRAAPLRLTDRIETGHVQDREDFVGRQRAPLEKLGSGTPREPQRQECGADHSWQHERRGPMAVRSRATQDTEKFPPPHAHPNTQETISYPDVRERSLAEATPL